MKKLLMIVTMVCCIFLMCSCEQAITNPGNTKTIVKDLENYDSQSFSKVGVEVVVDGTSNLIR